MGKESESMGERGGWEDRDERWTLIEANVGIDRSRISHNKVMLRQRWISPWLRGPPIESDRRQCGRSAGQA